MRGRVRRNPIEVEEEAHLTGVVVAETATTIGGERGRRWCTGVGMGRRSPEEVVVGEREGGRE